MTRSITALVIVSTLGLPLSAQAAPCFGGPVVPPFCEFCPNLGVGLNIPYQPSVLFYQVWQVTTTGQCGDCVTISAGQAFARLRMQGQTLSDFDSASGEFGCTVSVSFERGPGYTGATRLGCAGGDMFVGSGPVYIENCP